MCAYLLELSLFSYMVYLVSIKCFTEGLRPKKKAQEFEITNVESESESRMVPRIAGFEIQNEPFHFWGRRRERVPRIEFDWVSEVLGRYKCAFFQFQNLPIRSSPKPLLFSSYFLSKTLPPPPPTTTTTTAPPSPSVPLQPCPSHVTVA